MTEDVKTPDVQEPAAPSPDEIFSSALGGSSLSDYLGGDDVSTPEPDPVSVEPDRLEEMEKKVAAMEDNAKTQHANWNQEHMARLQAENFVGALQTARQQELQQAQQAAALAPPQFDTDWAEVMDDPERMGQEISRQNQAFAEWSANRTMGAMMPYVQQYQQQQGQFAAVLESSVEGMLDKGREVLQRGHGVNPDDFERYREQIKHAFTTMGPDGVKMLADTDNIVGSYAMLAMKDNIPFNASPGDPAPFHADNAPSRSGNVPNLKQTPARLRNMWDHMKADFGFEAPTLEEMREHGVDIDRYQKG